MGTFPYVISMLQKSCSVQSLWRFGQFLRESEILQQVFVKREERKKERKDREEKLCMIPAYKRMFSDEQTEVHVSNISVVGVSLDFVACKAELTIGTTDCKMQTPFFGPCSKNWAQA